MQIRSQGHLCGPGGGRQVFFIKPFWCPSPHLMTAADGEHHEYGGASNVSYHVILRGYKSLYLLWDKIKKTPITVRTAPDEQNQLHASTQLVDALALGSCSTVAFSSKKASFYLFQPEKNPKKVPLMQRLHPSYSLLTHKKAVSCTIFSSFVIADKMRNAALKQNYWLSEGL